MAVRDGGEDVENTPADGRLALVAAAPAVRTDRDVEADVVGHVLEDRVDVVAVEGGGERVEKGEADLVLLALGGGLRRASSGDGSR